MPAGISRSLAKGAIFGFSVRQKSRSLCLLIKEDETGKNFLQGKRWDQR